ncbi:helix-turn-helix domain-containing protein [Gordonia sp. NPDC003376]
MLATPRRETPGVSTTADFAALIGDWHHGWEIRVEGVPSTDAALRRHHLDGLDLIHCTADSCSGTRSRPSIDSHDDSLLGLLTVVEGREIVEVDGVRTVVDVGESLLWDTRSTGGFVASGPLRKFTVLLPRDLVTAWTPHVGELLEAGALPAGQTLGLRALADALERTPDPVLATQSATALGSAFRELLYVALGVSDRPSVNAWSDRRWRAALEYIEDRLPGPTTAEELAAHLSVSARSVYQMFADRETTVRGHQRRRRLYRARAEILRNPDRPITEIARDWNFSDQSAFTKAYRHTFDERPSDTRRR